MTCFLFKSMKYYFLFSMFQLCHQTHWSAQSDKTDLVFTGTAASPMSSSLSATKAKTAPPASVSSWTTCSSACMAAKRLSLRCSLCLPSTPAPPVGWPSPTAGSGLSAWNRCAGELWYGPTVPKEYAPPLDSALMLRLMSVRTRTVHRQTCGCSAFYCIKMWFIKLKTVDLLFLYFAGDKLVPHVMRKQIESVLFMTYNIIVCLKEVKTRHTNHFGHFFYL